MYRIFGCLLLLSLAGSGIAAQTIATLRAGDVFDLRMSGMPQESAAEFTLQYTVSQEGTVNVPLIGAVRAAGLTSAQLEQSIQNKLVGAKIFTQPTVLVNVVQANRYTSVSGGVRQPQRLPWSSDLTLSSAIGNCGGLTEFAKFKGIRVIREGKVAGTYNLHEVQNDPGLDPKLLPGDQVVVRE